MGSTSAHALYHAIQVSFHFTQFRRAQCPRPGSTALCQQILSWWWLHLLQMTAPEAPTMSNTFESKWKSTKILQRSTSRIPPYNWRRTFAWSYHRGKWRAQTDSNKPSRAEVLLEWSLVLEWALVGSSWVSLVLEWALVLVLQRPFSCTLQLFPLSILVDCVCTPGGSAKVKTGSHKQDWAQNKI